MTCSFNVCPGGTTCDGCQYKGGMPVCIMSLYSVAVKPTPEEVKQRGLYYDERYYEDRERKYVTETPEEAVRMYIEDDKAKEDRPDICMKKGDHFFLQRAEIPYVRARVVTK